MSEIKYSIQWIHSIHDQGTGGIYDLKNRHLENMQLRDGVGWGKMFTRFVRQHPTRKKP